MRISLIAILVSLLIISLPVVEAESMSQTYDANGNLVSDGITYRIYNDFNQLTEVRNGTNASAALLETYQYHPIEERITIKKTYNSSGALIESAYYHDQNFITLPGPTNSSTSIKMEF